MKKINNMNYNELLENARKNVGPYCKACAICNGIACSNKIPGPGAKGVGDNAIRNYSSWKDYKLIYDTISDVSEVDTSFNFFNLNLSNPIMIAPVGAVQSHYSNLYTDLEYNKIMLTTSRASNILGFVGDGLDENIVKDAVKVLSTLNGEGIITIKPWDIETMKKKIDISLTANPIALACDIDASGLPFLKNRTPKAGCKTVSELKEIINYSKKPFIIKGILSVEAARKAYLAGASAIVVSNHGGRVLDESVTTSSVLKEIAKEFKGKMMILVDGGIRSGADIFKALALGADACLIARPYVVAIYGSSDEGVKILTDKLHSELADAMLMCGCKTLKDINYNMIKKEER